METILELFPGDDDARLELTNGPWMSLTTGAIPVANALHRHRTGSKIRVAWPEW